MEHVHERPAKRTCLQQVSAFETRNTSSAHYGMQDEALEEEIRNFSTEPERQLGCLTSLPDQHEERPSRLQNELLDVIRTSSRESRSICPQQSVRLTESVDLICYGSITSFSVAKVQKLTRRVKLEAKDTGQLCQPDHTTCGRLARRDVKLLNLLKKEGIDSDLLWIPASKDASVQLDTLWLTIYGSRELATDVGDTLQEAEVFLQDPIHSERNTLYWNPQRFRNTEGLYTSSLKCDAIVESYPEFCQFEAIDVLKDFISEDNLPETEGATLLCTVLKSHQMRGLTFMVRREQGWQLDTKNGDVWAMTHDEAGNTTYLNNLDNSFHYEPPVPFYGGIVADDMGLGKTLSMIALIAHDRSVSPKPGQKRTTTLVVVPPSLLSTWEEELRERTSPGHLSWFLYHGPSRAARSCSFSDFDIVFTTYSTLAREWVSKLGRTNIFTYHWHRVILDEAHVIKNGASATSQAACALNADCRWAVTATPIQNRLSELLSLIRFLRLYPYNEQKGLTMESDCPKLAIERLKMLLRYIMLRRRKDILHLPKRTDIVVPLEFEGQDQAKYNQAKQVTIQYLDNIIGAESVSNGYMNAISKINTLRMVCNLGCSTDATTASSDAAPSQFNSDVLQQEAIFISRASTDPVLDFDDLSESASTCIICGMLILTSPWPGPEYHVPQHMARMGSSELMVGKGSEQCWSCFSDSIGALEASHVGASMLQMVPQIPFDSTPNVVFSTKVKALVNDLKTQRQANKSIVFSFWKSTLELASSALEQTGFTCLQVDGDVPPNQRSTILQRFSELDTEVVLLMSLSCGAIGLNLTAASRAYLMEPQWNPAIEEQALARVYRLGQTKPVVTVRFFVKKSIEEYVRQVQEAKQELVDMLLSSKSSEGNSKVMELRKILS